MREERAWRHLDSCAFQTWLVARVPGVQCPTHGIKTVGAPWAEPHSRFTLAFTCFARRVLHATQKQSLAAQLLRLSPMEVHDLLDRVVRQELAARATAAGTPTRKPSLGPHLTLDEKQHGRGQEYLTVLGDPTAGRVVDVSDTRTEAATVALLERTGPPGARAEICTVSMDLWAPFRAACAQVLPQADRIYDRFHAAQELNDAVDATRREEQRRLRTAAAPAAPATASGAAAIRAETLKGSRFWWLRNAEDLSEACRRELEAAHAAGFRTAQVWKCKEAFREFYTQPNAAAGEEFLEQWHREAQAVGSEPLTQVAETFLRHREMLLASLRHQRTNAFAEAMYEKFQQVKAAARGFRNFDCYRRAILFYLGRLGGCPQTSS